MADWREEDGDPWPVKFPVETPPYQAGGRFRRQESPRWAGTEKVDTGEVRKRLLWLLLAVEGGMVVAAACVLPLVFLNLPVGEKGVPGAIMREVGSWLGVSSETTCLIVALPALILAITLSFNLWFLSIVRNKHVQEGKHEAVTRET